LPSLLKKYKNNGDVFLFYILINQLCHVEQHKSDYKDRKSKYKQSIIALQCHIHRRLCELNWLSEEKLSFTHEMQLLKNKVLLLCGGNEAKCDNLWFDIIPSQEVFSEFLDRTIEAPFVNLLFMMWCHMFKQYGNILQAKEKSFGYSLFHGYSSEKHAGFLGILEKHFINSGLNNDLTSCLQAGMAGDVMRCELNKCVDEYHKLFEGYPDACLLNMLRLCILSLSVKAQCNSGEDMFAFSFANIGEFAKILAQNAQKLYEIEGVTSPRGGITQNAQ